MASNQGTVEYLADQMGRAGTITSRKMFGEYGIYCGSKFVALICDDQLYMKPTVAGRAWMGDKVEEAPPYPGAKLWLVVDGDRWDDSAWLSELAAVTAAELPEPKPKPDPKPRKKP